MSTQTTPAVPDETTETTETTEAASVASVAEVAPAPAARIRARSREPLSLTAVDIDDFLIWFGGEMNLSPVRRASRNIERSRGEP